MKDDPSRLRGAPLLLARLGALAVSLGILGFLMIRAGAGCRSPEASAVAEARSAAPATSAPPPASASNMRYKVFFPGTKNDPHILHRSEDGG